MTRRRRRRRRICLLRQTTRGNELAGNTPAIRNFVR